MKPAEPRLRLFAPGDLTSSAAIRAAAFAPLAASFRASLGTGTGKVALPLAYAEQAGHHDDVRADTPYQELVATMTGVVVDLVSFRADAIERIEDRGRNALGPAQMASAAAPRATKTRWAT